MKCLLVVLFSLSALACSSPTAPSGPQAPLGPPLVVKTANGYIQNPLVTLPPGVTIDPTTGAIVYPPDWASHASHPEWTNCDDYNPNNPWWCVSAGVKPTWWQR